VQGEEKAMTPLTSAPPTNGPSRRMRLTWWFCIYLAGVLVPNLFLFLHNYFDPLTLLTPIVGIFVFPSGLAGFINFLPNGGNAGGRYVSAVAVMVPLAYAAYITHLVYTLKTKTRRAFQLLLLGLVIIVSMNLAGCFKILSELR
jgi:hypothetical protein